MKYTGNYNLKKPEGSDVVNIEDLNDNADIIDSELKKLNDAIKDLDADGITLPDGKTISEKFTEITTEIGNTEELDTETKLSLVAAINEINQELETHKADDANPHGITKSQIGLGNVENYGIATQTEAEAGTSNAKYMTPLRVKQAINSAKVISVFSGMTTKTGDGVYDNIVIPLGKVPTKYIKLLGTGSYNSYGHCFIDLASNMFYGFENYFLSDTVRSKEIVAELGTFDKWSIFHILGADNPSSSPRLTGVTVSGSDLILRYRHNGSTYAKINNLIVEVV